MAGLQSKLTTEKLGQGCANRVPGLGQPVEPMCKGVRLSNLPG